MFVKATTLIQDTIFDCHLIKKVHSNYFIIVEVGGVRFEQDLGTLFQPSRKDILQGAAQINEKIRRALQKADLREVQRCENT